MDGPRQFTWYLERWGADVGADVRCALRQIAGAPLVSAVILLVLTLGIGTSAVVLTVIDGILFRAPPGVGDTEGLVEIVSITDAGFANVVTYPEFLAYRDLASVFEEVAVYAPARVALRADGGPGMGRAARAEFVSSGYFAALDVQMELGVGFAPRDDRQIEGAAHAVLGHGYWQRSLGGSPEVVGRTVEVNGRPYTVVGVAPEGFFGAGEGDDPVALWLPASDIPLLFPDDESPLSGSRAFQAIARLAEGVTIARAEAAARNAWLGVAGSDQEAGLGGRRRIAITPYRGIGSLRMTVAFGVVAAIGGLVAGLVLLIACANASGLLLGRALGRRREIGVRLALGGGRGRIVRQLLTESLLLAAIAGTAGVLLTFWTLDALGRALFHFPIDLAPSLVTLALTLGVAGATGVAFGITPALHATRVSVFTALKDDVARPGPWSSRLRDRFMVAQLALSLPLLTATGVLVGELTSTRPESGFKDPDGVLALWIDLGLSGYAADEVGPLFSRIRERVAALGGVSGTAFTSGPPFGGSGYRVRLPSPAHDGGPVATDRPLVMTVVDPEYFATVGIPILRGRAIDPSDVAGAPLVAVVGEDVARRAWPGQDALGRTLVLRGGAHETPITVVGVARSDRSGWSSVLIYGARSQLPDSLSATLFVRAIDGSASDLVPLLRAELGALAPDLVVNATVLSDAVRNTELAHGAAGAAACGLMAVLLVCIGLFGMIAMDVAERTREIGVRI
ncbi:MAG TPA: ABC transporter permease, partial [Longimicrobiales bacterium]|nr:ABC transporter permease [Longimicrobiales bacterium]